MRVSCKYEPLKTPSSSLITSPDIPDLDPSAPQDEEYTSLVTRIRDRRIAAGHPEGLVELDRALLHSPPIAAGWNAFLGAVRTQTETVSDTIREIVICRVAARNGAAYEWKHHVPILKRAMEGEGWSEKETEELVEIARGRKGMESMFGADGERKESWVKKVKAVLEYIDGMTRDVVVADAVWNEFRQVCDSEREAVEITSICSAYNCVSRFLVALDVAEARWED